MHENITNRPDARTLIGPEDAKPEVRTLVSTPHLRGLIAKELRRIETIEATIKEARDDITAIIDGLVKRGINKSAIKIALARRKLANAGKLESVDESLSVICGIGTLGIQGDLFADAGNGLGQE